jgi:hypothetical protein
MRYAKLAVCVLIAVSACSLVAGASASAEAPEYGRCLKLKGGKFKNAACTVRSKPGEERFEWYPGFSGARPIAKAGFTQALASNTLITFESAGSVNLKVTCSGLHAAGSYTGAKSLALPVFVLSGCASGSLSCTSAGKAGGEIALDPLVGLLGVIKKGTKPVENVIGEDLRPETSEEIAQFACSGIPAKWRGSIIFPVLRNKMILSATLTLNAPTCDVERFEGGERDILEASIAGGPFEPVGCAGKITHTNAEKIEVSSIN